MNVWYSSNSRSFQHTNFVKISFVSQNLHVSAWVILIFVILQALIDCKGVTKLWNWIVTNPMRLVRHKGMCVLFRIFYSKNTNWWETKYNNRQLLVVQIQKLFSLSSELQNKRLSLRHTHYFASHQPIMSEKRKQMFNYTQTHLMIIKVT